MDNNNANEETLQDKASKAVERFLERYGYDILDKDFTALGENQEKTYQIVAREQENNCLVFVEILIEKGNWPDEKNAKITRRDFENISATYAVNRDCEPSQVRGDIISVCVLSKDKAMIRHHHNVFMHD